RRGAVDRARGQLHERAGRLQQSGRLPARRADSRGAGAGVVVLEPRPLAASRVTRSRQRLFLEQAPMRWPRVAWLLLWLATTAVAAALGCRRSAEEQPPEAVATAPPWFADVTTEAGLDFIHDPGPTGAYFVPQIIGSGAAL